MISIYQLIGGCPTAIGTVTTKDTAILYQLLSMVHLLLASVQLLLVLGFHESFFNPRDMFGLVNDTIKYCGVGFAYYTIVIESYVRRHRHVQFWQKAARLQLHQNGEPMSDTTPTSTPTTTAKKSNVAAVAAVELSVDRMFLLQLGAFCTMSVLLEAFLLPIIMAMEPSLRFWMMHRWTVTLSRLRHWQFVHYVRVVATELRTIAEHMECVVRYAAYGEHANGAAASVAVVGEGSVLCTSH